VVWSSDMMNRMFGDFGAAVALRPANITDAVKKESGALSVMGIGKGCCWEILLHTGQVCRDSDS